MYDGVHDNLGYHDGKISSSGSRGQQQTTTMGKDYLGCPAGHDQEYCKGYEAGYDEGYELVDALTTSDLLHRWSAQPDISRLSKPLQSRFRKLFLPRCTEEQFLNVAEVPKISPSIARYIGAAVWKSQGDIRDVISIGRLIRKSDGSLEIEQIINAMAKYGNMMMQDRLRGKER